MRAESPEQPPLFSATPEPPIPASQKIIPFEQVQRRAAGKIVAQFSQPGSPGGPPSDAPGKKPPANPRAASRKAGPPSGQGNLDFRPDSAQSERILATGVPAQVYGDSHVAPPMRRLTAGAMDVAMVLLGFAVFAASARIAMPLVISYTSGAAAGPANGSVFGAGKSLWMALATSMILISLLYGLVWTIARRETAGMNWTQLQLVTFDGSPLDGKVRAVRFISAWLSYCSMGLGLLWALADEENLAFHDHISKTYPAELGSAGIWVRQGR